MPLPARALRWLLLVAFAASAVVATAAPSEDVPDHLSTPVPARPGDDARALSKYRFMFGQPERWPGPLRWRYNPANAPSPFDADPSGTVAQIRAALESWTQVCGIRHVYEGETTAVPNSTLDGTFGGVPDYVNVVGWAPLEGNVAGLAFVRYNGGDLVDADIMLSMSNVRSQAEMQRTATHEWGHALGLAHSNVFGELMSGPPESQYNGLSTLQTDDIRGCRCLYGPAAGSAAGYSCSLPTRLDFGGVPVGGVSALQALTLTNNGNAPLTVHDVAARTLNVSHDSGCSGATVLAPGQSCTVNVVARPTVIFAYDDLVTFRTSDGAYVVPVSFTGISGPASAPVVRLVEYFHAGFGHYFVTHLVAEIAKLDDGTFAGWERTGRTIRAWAQPTSGSSPVCRFFSASFAPKSSHFYTSFAPECTTLKGNAGWTFEGEVFHVGLPAADGSCAAGTQPVYRLYNDGQGGAPNHRFTTDPALRSRMLAEGWVPEGTGIGVTMCSPL